jgi:hypothetical protein
MLFIILFVVVFTLHKRLFCSFMIDVTHGEEEEFTKNNNGNNNNNKIQKRIEF